MNEFESYKILNPKVFTDEFLHEQNLLKQGLENRNYGWYPVYKKEIIDKDTLFWTWVFLKFRLDERKYRLVHQSFKALYLADDILELKSFITDIANKNNMKLSYILKDMFSVKESSELIKNIHHINGNWDEVLVLYGKMLVLHDLLIMIFKYTDDNFIIKDEYSLKFKSFFD